MLLSDTNFVLIPEVPFALDGDGGFLNILRQRIESQFVMHVLGIQYGNKDVDVQQPAGHSSES